MPVRYCGQTPPAHIPPSTSKRTKLRFVSDGTGDFQCFVKCDSTEARVNTEKCSEPRQPIFVNALCYAMFCFFLENAGG